MSEMDGGKILGQDEIKFASGSISAILGDREQRLKAEQEGYNFSLGDMDVAQGEIARHAVFAAGISHFHPAAYLMFKSAEDRLAAIHAIHEQEPEELGWKWRTSSPRSEMTHDEWRTWIRQQPIEGEYLKGTSEDPNIQNPQI